MKICPVTSRGQQSCWRRSEPWMPWDGSGAAGSAGLAGTVKSLTVQPTRRAATPTVAAQATWTYEA